MGKTLFWIVTILVIAFLVYAWYAYYSAQPKDKSKVARMWGAIVAAAFSLGALVMSWFSTPPPTP